MLYLFKSLSFFLMAKIQKYGIKFPFGVTSEDKTLFDLNKSKADMVKSQLMHVLFTQKGQRIRQPEFGTNLIQFIFNPNDSQSWNDVKFELKDIVNRWVPDCNLDDIEIYENENGVGLVADITYSVSENNGTASVYELITKL